MEISRGEGNPESIKKEEKSVIFVVDELQGE